MTLSCILQTEGKTQKINDITEHTAEYIEINCGCNVFSDDYITNQDLLCTDDPNQVVFQATVVTTEERESNTFLATEIAALSMSEPEVTLGGLPLKVNSQCPVNLYTADRPECNIGPNATPPTTNTNSVQTSSPGQTVKPGTGEPSATDEFGNIISVTDEFGNIISITDEFGNIISRVATTSTPKTVSLTHELIGGVFGGFMLLAILIVIVALVSCYILRDRVRTSFIKTGDM